ncbi:MAG: DNA polymerase III subunit delta', partial [Spirulinaceae cyanobacterium]
MKIIGQPQAIELLTSAIEQNRLAPAYLFAGYPGIGKSLMAQYFIEFLFCHQIPIEKHPNIKKKLLIGNHPDLLWVQPTYQHQGKLLTAKEATEIGLKKKAPPQIRTEQIREITRFLSRPPLEASRSIVVIEDAQTMAESPANALLKTLEEPGKASLILIAPNADSLLPTLVSRCQRIPFYRLAVKEMEQVLQSLGRADILSEQTILAIAQGSPGEAIYAWEQLQTIPDELLTKLQQIPNHPVTALGLAKEIVDNLETETQLWLINYLQYIYWEQKRQANILQKLEDTRK